MLLSLVLAVPCEASTLEAECHNGVFTGFVSDDVITWLGVPYAKAPTGPLRWKAPEAPDESTEHFNAFTFGDIPLQVITESRKVSLMPQGEDCLKLNVWKASGDNEALRPVLVWIHGGSFKTGGTPSDEHQGCKFVKANPEMIFVSIEYRTGLMGFIDLSQVPGGSEYKESGNLQLLDIVQGLKWLKENVASFGGDPDNITMAGQSSGSASIALIMTMPEAKGLFRRAILESGAVSMSTKRSDCLELAEKLLKLTGKTDMNGLLSLTSKDLQNAAEKLDAYTNFPELDGVVLTSGDIYEAFAANAGDYDLLIGSNADEIRYWLAALNFDIEAYGNMLSTAYESIKAGVTAAVPETQQVFDSFMYINSGDLPVWSETAFFTDLLFRVPAVQMAELHRRGSGRTYMYYWKYYTPGVADALDLIGACHAFEIPYVTGNPSSLVPAQVLEATSQLRAGVQGMWKAFASGGYLPFSEYGDNFETVIIDSEGIHEGADEHKEETALMRNLLPFGFSGRELISAIAEPYEEEPETPGDDPGGSGGGCNAGWTLLVLVVVPCVAVRRGESPLR